MYPREKAIEILEKINNSKISSEDWNNATLHSKEELKRKCYVVVMELIKEASDKNVTIRYKNCSMTDKEYWQEVKRYLDII